MVAEHHLAITLLRELGADTLWHGADSLFEHLCRTALILRAWGSMAAEERAGLCHSVYDILLAPNPQARERLSAAIGRDAEAIVYHLATRPLTDLEQALLLDRAGGVPGAAALVQVASDLDLLGRVPLPRRQFERQRNLAALALSRLEPAAAGDLKRLYRLETETTRGWRAAVADAYDAGACRHEAQRRDDSDDVRLLEFLDALVPAGGCVLDLGCGGGRPVTAYLARRFRVVGVDVSKRQLELAREAAPTAKLVHADMLDLPFANGAFDAVVSYYAIIHVPRALHVLALAEARRVLRPNGWALLCLGATDKPAEYEVTLLDRPILFSHFDEGDNLDLLAEQGFTVRWHGLIGGGSSTFLFVLAQASGTLP